MLPIGFGLDGALSGGALEHDPLAGVGAWLGEISWRNALGKR